MEWESDSPCCRHTHPRKGHGSPGRCSGWELEFRDCGAIPGRGLLLTAERWIEGIWERRLWWQMPVEERRAAMEARRYCWVTCRGWSHHTASLSPHTPAYGVEQQRGWTIQMPDTLNYRVGPHPACPFKCLNRRSYGERLAKEAFWSPATRSFKKTLIGPWLLGQRQSMSRHTWCH